MLIFLRYGSNFYIFEQKNDQMQRSEWANRREQAGSSSLALGSHKSNEAWVTKIGAQNIENRKWNSVIGIWTKKAEKGLLWFLFYVIGEVWIVFIW